MQFDKRENENMAQWIKRKQQEQNDRGTRPKPTIQRSTESYGEMQDRLAAEARGKQAAAAEAERQRKAAEPQAAPNPFRVLMDLVSPVTASGRRKRADLLERAEQHDRAAARLAEQRRAEAERMNSPELLSCKDQLPFMRKFILPEEQDELSEIVGVIDAGDAELAGSRLKTLESRILDRLDAEAAKRKTAAVAASQDFHAAVDQAESFRLKETPNE
jgi:hypothetical protein